MAAIGCVAQWSITLGKVPLKWFSTELNPEGNGNMSYHKAGISQARHGCAGSGADLRARGDCGSKERKHGYHMPAVELPLPRFT